MTELRRARLFVAAEVPESHLGAIARRTDDLRRRFPDARWTPVDNQHVTLKFLGGVLGDRMREIEQVCTTVARSLEPAGVSVADLGSFPSARRIRVLWVGLEDPQALLSGAARDLDQAFEPLGFASEARPFTPHVTLARFKVPVRLEEALPDLPLRDLDPFEVDRLVLFESHLSPKGARYEVLEEFKLGR